MARRSSSARPRTTKSKYSALYVGSAPCTELPNVDDVAAAVRDLVRGGGGSSTSSTLPRLALTVSGKGLKVVRARSDAGRRRRRGPGGRGAMDSGGSVRHALTDVALVGHGVEEDVRAAAGVVLHGFDGDTGGWLHVHAYWFDDGGPDAAARFVRQLTELMDTPQHRDAVRQLEATMIAGGQLRPRSRNPPAVADVAVRRRSKANGKAGKYARQRLSAADAAVYRQPEVEICRQSSLKTNDDCKWPERQARVSRTGSCDLVDAEYIMWYDAPPPDDDAGSRLRRAASVEVPTPVASLTSELRARLATGAPILLPPKDYDTMSRSRGNLNGIDERRCVNVDIVGGRTRRSASDTGTPQTYL